MVLRRTAVPVSEAERKFPLHHGLCGDAQGFAAHRVHDASLNYTKKVDNGEFALILITPPLLNSATENGHFGPPTF
jgi:hypothetical protein